MIKNEIITEVLNYYPVLVNSKIEKINSGLDGWTFLAKKTNEKYILKVYPCEKRIEDNVLMTKFMNENGLPAPIVYDNKASKPISIVGDYQATLFQYCSGEQITWNNLSDSFSSHLAKIVSGMHLLMLKSDITKCEGAYAYKTHAASPNQELIDEKNQLLDALETIDLSKLRSCLIHGDLTRQNVLVDERREKVSAIIDFGDAHCDYIAWDLAVLITHIFITKTYGIDWRALTKFLQTYSNLNPLSRAEMESLLIFAKIRNLNLAIEMDSLIEDNHDISELKSIKDSVLTKNMTIDKNWEKLNKLVLSCFS